MQQKRPHPIDGLVAGIDEAGRGPLAGPVVAAAVILSANQDTSEIRDSKQLTAATRERLATKIREEALAWSVAWADRAEIDALNILQATMLAMRRAILRLNVFPDAVQIDGNRVPDLQFGDRRIEGQAIVGGDTKIPAIAAASILAKTSRDEFMQRIDALYPNYGFASHKGYGTQMHRDRLKMYGPCDQHRQSFAPVRAAT